MAEGKNDASMTFRLDADLHMAFLYACKRNDQSAAQVLRAFMREYVAENRQGSLPLKGGAKRKGAE